VVSSRCNAVIPFIAPRLSAGRQQQGEAQEAAAATQLIEPHGLHVLCSANGGDSLMSGDVGISLWSLVYADERFAVSRHRHAILA
jgi:hypothetical protein